VTPNEFKKYLRRDQYCWHCGATDETLIPQHRANRGMGSVKSRNRPSNIIVLCSAFNQAIESDASKAALAKDYGWKISGHDNPLFIPLFDVVKREWFFLDDEFGKFVMYKPLIE
jgi:hypothetical protein